MENQSRIERFHTVVIGGGQSGLAMGYHLSRRGIPFVVLDAGARVGDTWRKRWDSLRLFTAARYDSLPGLRFPAPAHSFPTKDEMADYLETYARTFRIPVQCGVRVDSVSRVGRRYLVTAGVRRIEAEHVVIAMARYQEPRVPEYAEQLHPEILQLHSKDYRNPTQLRAGPVLVVGAGNSGAEIAVDLARRHPVLLAGRDVGHVPIRTVSGPLRFIVQPLLFRVFFHRILTNRTAIGRKFRDEVLTKGAPLIRTRPRDLLRLGVERVPKVTGVQDGMPMLEDGGVLDVTNVIWCTGFHAATDWIRVPAFGPDGAPLHENGVVKGQPGLYFLGLPFISAFSSAMIHGVGRDAERIARVIENRLRASQEHGADQADLHDAAAVPK